MKNPRTVWWSISHEGKNFYGPQKFSEGCNGDPAKIGEPK